MAPLTPMRLCAPFLVTRRALFFPLVATIARAAQLPGMPVGLHLSADLYAQSTSKMLESKFPSGQIEYLLLDVRSRQVMAMRWAFEQHPMPAGSLFKPFVALAYAEMNQVGRPGSVAYPDEFPIVECHGRRDSCWSAAGHGRLTLQPALAKSCNAYFLALAKAVAAHGSTELQRISQKYNLPAPPELVVLSSPDVPDLGPEQAQAVRAQAVRTQAIRAWIGLSPEWQVTPLELALAYAQLATQSRCAAANLILAGMQMAGQPGGTASRVGDHPGGLLAKTGTAPALAIAEERSRENGESRELGGSNHLDGLVVLLTPADDPHLLLLVRQRGVTGAIAAQTAGKMLSSMEREHAPSA